MSSDPSAQVQELEDAAVTTGKSIVKLCRDVRDWEVAQWFRDTVDAFKKTMPLISDLRNSAMRDRHWQQLMEQTEQRIHPESDDFTLNSIIALRLDTHADYISSLSANASKELAVEQGIAAIAEAWNALELDMVRALRRSASMTPAGAAVHVAGWRRRR